MTTKIISKSFTQLFENGLFSTEEDFNIEEMRECYAEFFQDEYFARTQITGTKTVEALDEKYTVYVIQIQLPFTEYLIEKRYTQFLDLYKKIEKNYKSIAIGRTNFPAKKFFGTFNEATIQTRRSLLGRFLTFLGEIYKQEQMVEFLEFIEMKKRIEMLIRLPTVDVPACSLRPSGERLTVEEQVNYFLNIFNRHSRDLCRSFKELETFIFEQRPKFDRITIKKLLYGDEQLDGLIHLCGKVDCYHDSHLTCGAGLHLLNLLLDYECNKDAELFNQIFGFTSLRDIMCLHFDKHIQGKSFRQCKVAAMKLLNNFLNQNPNIAIDQIVSDDEVIQEFETWKNSHQTTSIKAESFFKF